MDRSWGKTTVTLEPVGVAGLITAWNANALFVCLKLASAVAAGCTAVIKPSELSSLQTRVLIEALHEAKLPKGLLNVVTGRGDVVGAELVRNPDVNKIYPRVLPKLFRTRNRAVAEQHRAVERRRHNQPIKLGCREQRIVNRKSATVREPFDCRRKRCNRPPRTPGIERRTKFWKASYLADHEPAQLQDPGSENDFELSDGIADQVAL